MLKSKPNEEKLSMLYDRELNGTEGKKLWDQLKECSESQKIMRSFDEDTKKMGRLFDLFAPQQGFSKKMIDQISQNKSQE